MALIAAKVSPRAGERPSSPALIAAAKRAAADSHVSFAVIALIGMTAFLVVSGCASAPRRPTAKGAAVFADNCSSCHSLIGNESQHKTGGDLVGYAFSRSVLLQYASEMPTPNPLTRAQLQAVVDYVRRAESGSARRG